MISAASSNRIDIVAAGLSAACVVHCLALPTFAAMAPLLATWSDVEWVHKSLVLTAAPLSLFASLERSGAPGGRKFMLVAFASLGLLLSAAFVEAFHEYERPLTALGGIVLGGAHVAWWRRHRVTPDSGTLKE
ncbi:MAG: MerC domain-containing protein [Pseudomonadota bacterium]